MMIAMGYQGNGPALNGPERAKATVDQFRMARTGSARFWDRIAERYARTPVADQATFQKKLQFTREHLCPDMELLEFGCGTGSTAIAHAPFVKHILALDISSKMIEIAHGKAEANGIRNVTFSQSAIEDFAAPQHSFDVVLGLSILHLLKDKEDAISKVHELLKPGGVFVSSTACLGDSMSYFKLIAPIGRLFGLLPLVNVFTIQELRDALIHGGFEIEQQWQPGKGKGVFIVAKKAS